MIPAKGRLVDLGESEPEGLLATKGLETQGIQNLLRSLGSVT